MLDIGRQADLKELTRELSRATGGRARDIERTIEEIMNENGFTRSMRQSLIREAKQGRFDNVKDISDQVARSRDARFR